ncbi:MAG TPA: CBS domain-containing protein [bacterium]|nr:CBS domain-containing protein [bacterium]
MKVQDIMTRTVRTCGRSTNLAEAAMIMWHNDCGVVPVVEPDGRAVGVITDRDICMATATRPLKAAEITAGDVMTGALFTCRPEEAVKKALQTMAHHRVRRLVVVDANGRLAGIVSMDDFAIHAGKDLPAKAIVDTLRSICSRKKPGTHGTEPSPDPFSDAWF